MEFTLHAVIDADTPHAPRPLHIALVAEGDANTEHCWSGSALGFVSALRRLGHRVDCIDVELRGVPRVVSAAATFRRDRERWRQEFILGSRTFQVRSALARRKVAKALLHRTDVLVQVGASFTLAGLTHSARRILYADGNAAMAEQAGPFSEIHHFDRRDRAALRERERQVYGTMERIWTFSRFLADSFERDFGVQASRLEPIFGGANRSELVSLPPAQGPAREPRILFVGKQWQRKGLPVLLDAFREVRNALPGATLHVVGPDAAVATGDGIVGYGMLRPWVPAEAARLAELFRTSAVFCLPSRYEPFGVAFIEAMLASLPCIGTAQWAMPEIIDHGTTGLLVPDGDHRALTTALLDLLQAPDRAHRMGLAGREKARASFTWDAVAQRAVQSVRRLQESAVTRRDS